MAVVLLWLIYCLMYLPLFVGVLFWSLFGPLKCITLCPFSFSIVLTRKREKVALRLLSFECLVTVNVMWPFLTVL